MLRVLRIVGAALLAVGVVLGATVGIGYLLGANRLPWQEAAAGGTGAQLYANNCAVCHGTRGAGGTGPSFVAGGALHELTFAQRVERIASGKPLAGMPAWKFHLSDDEIRRVAAYTQVLSGQTPDPSVQEVE